MSSDNNHQYSIIDDAPYSETARALAMALHSRDEQLISHLMETSVYPLLDEEDGLFKMIMACIRSYHSLAFAMSLLMGIDVPDVIRMDATADYMSQDILADRIQDEE